ncbi:MAG: serine/threonine-protein kinase [Pirellulaceae bacterium]
MKSPIHANHNQLQTLLFGDEDCSSSTETAQHVESCWACQQRLSEMASIEAIEPEVSQLLSGFDDANVEAENCSMQALADRAAKTAMTNGFEVELEPPSHPEMLGRLGRYEIERVIGSGGMGVVFKAFDTELNRPVAVKVLAPHLARNGAAKQRFGRESRAAAAVVHDNVVAIHNVESDRASPFIVMQYVSGESLQSRVERLGPLGIQQILRIGIQAANGLAAAHEQGIVHRDVKPANILLEDGVERVLLTDFGLARTVDDASLTHTGVVAGTPQYMSPEQANGDAVDHRSDLFSLGSVLYFVATGHPPFRAERAMGVLHRICHEPHRPVWQVNAEVADELSDVIDRLLQKRPSNRFASALAVRDALTRILQQSQNRRPSMRSRIRFWTRRHPGLARLTLAGVVLLAVGLALRTTDFVRSRAASAVGSHVEQRVVDSFPFSSEGSGAQATGEVYSQRSNVSPTVAEIVTKDSVSFTHEIRQLHRALDILEGSNDAPRHEVDWRQEIDAIQSQLNQIERD